MKEKNPERIQAIGKRIKELRKKAGYTSYETFAVEHDMPRKNYWRLEKGYNFTISTLIEILEIHDMTLEEFFKGLE